jgi:hypothetical protein
MASQKKKLLVFWSSTDFEDIYRLGVQDHPDYEIELVSLLGLPHERASYRRLLRLRREVDEGKFDLVVSNNIMRSPFPRNKSWATTASLAARLFTYQHLRMDTWWAPWMVRYGKSRTPLAVIDARDGVYIYPWDLPLLKAAKLYFKKDLMNWPRRTLLPLQDYYTEKKIRPYQAKLRPMSLGLKEVGVAPSARPVKDRDVDIFMNGSENPLRQMIRERCQKLSGRYRVVAHPGVLSRQEYSEMLQRAKLSICMESYGGETWRQYEVAAAGSVPVLNWPFTQVTDPLVPDEHAFYFSYIGDHFERTIAKALGDDDQLQKMSTAGREFVLTKKPQRGMLNHVVETTLAEAKG